MFTRQDWRAVLTDPVVWVAVTGLVLCLAILITLWGGQ